MLSGMVKMIGDIQLLSTDDGGRFTPIPNGYRTDIKFRSGESRIIAIDFKKDFLFPGECCQAEINILLHSEKEIDYLLSGEKNTILDGENLIGDISILEVIDRGSITWSES